MRRLRFFGRFFVWFSLRYILKYPGRSCLVLCGIALGAAVFTSVRLSVHASLTSFSRSMDLIAGNTDRVVARPGGRLPEKLLAQLMEHSGVAAASPVLSTYVHVGDGDDEPFLLIGFDPILDRPLRSWHLTDPSTDIQSWRDLLAEPATIVMAKPLAHSYGLKKGDIISLTHPHRRLAFRIAGVLAPQGLARADGGRIALTDIATFQEFTGLHGLVDRIDLKLKPGSDGTGLAGRLPEGIHVYPAVQAKESGLRMMRAYQLNLSILSFVSLFVGMFLVYSVVALNAAARRRELAILLSVGASPRLLFVLFLAEGALFGVLGWIAAIPLGSFGVRHMLHGVNRTISTLFVRTHVDALSVSGWELSLSFGVTLLVALAAAMQPAREAMQVAPKEALTGSMDAPRSQRTGTRLARLGAAMILAAWPLSHLPAPASLPLPGYGAVFLVVAGFSLLSPWGLRRLGRGLTPLLLRTAGQPAFLAGRYLRDSGTRTAVSVGALITAVALFTALVIMIHSFRQTVELWVGQTISGDLFVRPKMAEFNRYRDNFPPAVSEALESLQVHADMQKSRRIYLFHKKDVFQFEATDFDVFMRYGDFLYTRNPPPSLPEALRNGEGVVVSEVFAHRTGLGTGDRFSASIDGFRLDRPILAVVRDYRTDGGIVFFSLARLRALTGTDTWNGARFFWRRPPPDPEAAAIELQQKIIAACGDRVETASGASLRRSILEIFDETFAITTVLLVIAMAVAALGITTTVAMLILDRDRQLNTLLAVGASPGQIRAMIFWEALLMIVAGEIAGLLCGFFLSYLLVFVINKESFGWTFHYGVAWKTLWWSLPLIFCTALSAALPAVHSVFRRPPAVALRQ